MGLVLGLQFGRGAHEVADNSFDMNVALKVSSKTSFNFRTGRRDNALDNQIRSSRDGKTHVLEK